MKDEAGVNEIEQDKKKALSPPPFTVDNCIIAASKFKEQDIWKIMRNFDPL